MLKINKNMTIIILLPWIAVALFLAIVEIVHVNSLNKDMRLAIAEHDAKYEVALKEIDVEKNKNAALLAEKNQLLQKLVDADARLSDAEKQLNLLRTELSMAKMPPHPKPVLKPVLKKAKKKKRIPYDIAPSQQ